MSEKTLKFDKTVVNKKDFHACKEGIALNLVESSRVLVSDKFKHTEDGFKHTEDGCIVLPTMSGYIKYFDNGRKNMLFLIEDESVYLEYTKIRNKIRKLLSVKFHSQPIHDDKYIKIKVKTFCETINTLFSNNKVPKEKNHYICIAAICVNPVLKIEGKNHLKCI